MTILCIALNIGKKNNIYLSSQTEVVFYSASEQISDQSFNKFFENNESVEDSKDEAYDKNDIKPQIEEEVLKKDIVGNNDDVVVDQKAETKKTVKQKNTQSQAKKEKKSSDNKNKISIKTKGKKVSKNTQQTPKVIGNNSNIQTHNRPDGDSSAFGVGSQYEGLSFENKDFKFSYYANQIVGKIKRHWNWSLNYNQLRAVIYFKIHKDGSVSDILVKKSSKNSDYDKFAADTIIRSSPFPELPEGYPEGFLGVYFEFVAK
ncbi:MAG: TonB C-terminal domain-containing protein [Endomicrobium sp.]|nr:TonB C-terminal domain-containing protein [Endomicrobium sp.]